MVKKKKTIWLLTGLLSGLFLTGCTPRQSTSDSEPNVKKTVSMDGNQIRIFSSAVTEPVRILMCSDTHLHLKDDREKPYESYSKRMAGAYNVTKHYQSGEPTCPQQTFLETIDLACSQQVDLLALTGDIFSFPSEAAIEWVDSILKDSRLNYVYTTGNHDWHYEGMEGASADLRQTWINKRLLPLYKGQNPLFYAIDVKGIQVVMIDNSTYEIRPDQLAFFQEQVKTGLPLVLMMHIPLYAPGRPVGYGCGHPDWDQEHDHGYQIERRETWPKNGHTPTTLQFREEVFNASNVLAVFCGHIHQQTVDILNDIPQFVVKENAAGNYYQIHILPMPFPKDE